MWNFSLIFMPLAFFLLLTCLLYFILWFRIFTEGRRIKATIGKQSMTSARVLVVTRNMSFFILVFLLRFTLPAVHGLWVYIEQPPLILYEVLTFATSAGGIFNGFIYLTVRREHL